MPPWHVWDLDRAWMQVLSQLRENKTCCWLGTLWTLPQPEWLQSLSETMLMNNTIVFRANISTEITSGITESCFLFSRIKNCHITIDLNIQLGSLLYDLTCVCTIQVNHYTQGTQPKSVYSQIFCNAAWLLGCITHTRLPPGSSGFISHFQHSQVGSLICVQKAQYCREMYDWFKMTTAIIYVGFWWI